MRAKETIQPLAKVLHLAVNDAYPRDDYKKMVAEVMHDPAYRGHTVLVCWEHKVIPQIAAEFGAKDAPGNWPGKEFDRAWVLDFKKDGGVHFKNLPQRLMYGDSER